MPDDFPENEIYWWMAKVPISFFLEVFTFVSGYILGYGVQNKGVETTITFNNCVIKKLKRLLLPSILFSTIYFLLVGDYNLPLQSILGRIINGYGHLWYLPMLFWCFVAIWLIEKIGIKPKYILPCLVICSIVFSIKDLPLRIDDALYYMLFFYLGYVINRNNFRFDRCFKWKCVLVNGAIYVLTFVSLHLLNRSGLLFEGGSLWIKIANSCWNKFSHMMYSMPALVFVYLGQTQ